VELGRVGIWAHLDGEPMARAREHAAEIEALGYGALWTPEAVGRDVLVTSAAYLDATQRMVMATGIMPIYSRTAQTTNAAWHTIEEAHPGRFVLGLGVSHAPTVEGLQHTAYLPPLQAMRNYLDAMDGALYFGAQPAQPPRRVLAALGPKMLALAAEKADGAHPYNVTPDHTATAREILGPGKLLAVEQKVALETDADAARRIGRETLAIYLTLPNYTNNWKRLGFTDDDFANGGSDRLIDAMFAWGDEETIRRRVYEHLDAGADHVCVHIATSDGLAAVPDAEWRTLAPALLG
jgi:probable F420-dependent oxidoreductase